MRVKKETMMKLIQESKAKYAEQGISDEKPTRYAMSTLRDEVLTC